MGISCNTADEYTQETPRVGTAIGDLILDLHVVAQAGLLDGIEGLNNPVSVFGQVKWIMMILKGKQGLRVL